MTLSIDGGTLLLPDGEVKRADIFIEDNRISDVGDVSEGDESLDASDCLVIPGLINAHTHAAMTLLRGIADDKPLGPWLREDIWPVEAELTPEDIRSGTELAIAEMIRSGTTTFADMYFEEGVVADVVESSGIRAVLGHGVVTVDKTEEEARRDVEESLEVAKRLDGRANGRIHGMVTPHGLTTVDDEHLEMLSDGARDLDVSLHFHASETSEDVEAIRDEYGVNPLEYADQRGLLRPSTFIAHGVHLTDEEIDLLAERGAGVVHCPASNMKLASGAAPIGTLRDRGVDVAIGTDGAASNNDLDMFDELRDAALLGKHARNNASAVPANVAVEFATVGGSAMLGIDAGRIEPGALADLAIIDLQSPHLTPVHNHVSHLAYAARGGDVKHTICNGDVLMRDRELTTLDSGNVMSNARRRARSLIARAEN
ncbi:MAG: amidohydrolase [Halobacteriaceae archaeon]